jgi:hypothetical protein
MPEYTIAHASFGNRPRAAHMGSQDPTKRFNPNDAIELSKVSMTNLSSAALRRRATCAPPRPR